MTVPSILIHASRDLERFLLDARHELGLGTTHQAYAAVRAVLVTFRGEAKRGEPLSRMGEGQG